VKHFSEGRENVSDEERSDKQRSTSRTEKNIAKVRQILYENHQLTVNRK